MRRTLLLAVPLLLLAACGDDTGAGSAGDSDNSLDGRTFVQANLTGHDLVKGSDIRLSFKDGNISASAGCNNLGGKGRIDDGKLVGGIDVMTEMGCPNPLMDQDIWLSDFLGSGPAATLDDHTLTLSKGDIKLTLTDEEHVRAQKPIPFDGTTWTLDSLVSGSGDDGAVSSVPGRRPATLTFNGEKFHVDTGCNEGGGKVTFENNSFTIKSFSITLVGCQDSPEQAVMAVLRDTVVFDQDYDLLTLSTPDGESGLQFRASVR